MQRDWEIQRRRLLALPSKLGFSSVRELKAALDLVSEADHASGTRKIHRPRKSRVVITDKIKMEVKRLAQAGEPGAEIAKRLNISTATVQNIKAALGLTRKHR